MRVLTAVRKGYESVTEKTEEVRMSPRVAKGKLKYGRKATMSPRRDESEKLMYITLYILKKNYFL